MKQGKSLIDLAKEVERQSQAKVDYLADTTALEVNNEGSLVIERASQENMSIGSIFPVTDYAHGQIADRLSIPKRYYDRMKQEAPELYKTNVNYWLHNNPEKRMIRTLDGKVRAFLSDRYRPLDNYDLLKAVLPVIQEKGAEIKSAEVTDLRLYIKAIYPKLEGEVEIGDIVQAGIVVSNSEVGAGSVKVEPLIYRLVCSNGMITNTSMKKYHIGRRAGEDDIFKVLSTNTKKVTDQAFWLQVKDIVRSAFNEDVFNGELDKLRKAKNTPEVKRPKKAVEIIQKEYGYSDKQGEAILENLLKGKDYTKYGMANAVTATANTRDDYEIATQMERDGAKIIELPQNRWEKIAEVK